MEGKARLLMIGVTDFEVRSEFEVRTIFGGQKLWMDHHTWWGGQTEGTTKKENRVLTSCGQALTLLLRNSGVSARYDNMDFYDGR